MTVPSPDDPLLIEAVKAALEACWNEGSPVAGSTVEARQRMALLAIRRASSFDRRGIAVDDREAQVRDLAKGLVASFEDDRDHVGPLIVDYRFVAARVLAAIHEFQAEPRGST